MGRRRGAGGSATLEGGEKVAARLGRRPGDGSAARREARRRSAARREARTETAARLGGRHGG